jgi:hypothetical protein
MKHKDQFPTSVKAACVSKYGSKELLGVIHKYMTQFWQFYFFERLLVTDFKRKRKCIAYICFQKGYLVSKIIKIRVLKVVVKFWDNISIFSILRSIAAGIEPI